MQALERLVATFQRHGSEFWDVAGVVCSPEAKAALRKPAVRLAPNTWNTTKRSLSHGPIRSPHLGARACLVSDDVTASPLLHGPG